MKRRTAQRVTTTGVSLLAAALTSITSAGATPADNGCPQGYEVLAVADLAPQGYQVPGMVDDPSSGITSFGSAGNGDGLVCAKAIGQQTTTWGGQLYQFWDNTLPA